jgi:membrane protein implicated in regulation of membrane protease activity
MGLDAVSRRRIVGCIFLTMAVLLLAAGETVLSGVGFVLYWMACFICTGLAMVVAYLDLRAVQRQTREEQRELVKDTLKEIETDAKKRPGQEPN